MSITLDLPDESELKSAAEFHAAEAAELEQADAAAAAVEEGDEVESSSGSLDDLHDSEFVEVAADPEATQLEEQTAAPAMPSIAAPQQQSPATPRQSAVAIRPAARPSALMTFEFERGRAVDEYIGATLECQKLEEAFKRAKKRMEAARDVLVEIESQRPDEDDIQCVESYPALKAGQVAAGEAEQGTAEATETSDCAGLVVESGDPDAWRSTPVSALLLPASTMAKFIEGGYTTIGQLEDLRAGAGLRSIKGIGQKKADAIEDAILNWLSKHRDKEVLATARQDAVEEVTAEVTTFAPTVAGEEVPAETAEPNQAGHDPRWHATIEARSQQIFFRTGDLSGVSPDDCLSQQLDDARYFESGWEAYNAGYDLIDCGYVPGTERDDWLRGWMSAKLTSEEGWQGPGTET
jgi:hypothetical protein